MASLVGLHATYYVPCPSELCILAATFQPGKSVCTSRQPFLIGLLSGPKISRKKSRVRDSQQMSQGLENVDNNLVGDTSKRTLCLLAAVWRSRDL